MPGRVAKNFVESSTFKAARKKRCQRVDQIVFGFVASDALQMDVKRKA
jgi:hypothetical protein